MFLPCYFMLEHSLVHLFQPLHHCWCCRHYALMIILRHSDVSYCGVPLASTRRSPLQIKLLPYFQLAYIYICLLKEMLAYLHLLRILCFRWAYMYGCIFLWMGLLIYLCYLFESCIYKLDLVPPFFILRESVRE